MKNSGQKKLSISIVNYNSGDFLVKCLYSLDKLKQKLSFDIWVVDNNSIDDSLSKAKKEFPKLNYIQNEYLIFKNYN